MLVLELSSRFPDFLHFHGNSFESFKVISLFSYQGSSLLSCATTSISYHSCSLLSSTFFIFLNHFCLLQQSLIFCFHRCVSDESYLTMFILHCQHLFTLFYIFLFHVVFLTTNTHFISVFSYNCWTYENGFFLYQNTLFQCLNNNLLNYIIFIQ